jgi:anti-sigma B factor antagonist
MKIGKVQTPKGTLLELSGRLDAEAGGQLVEQVTSLATAGGHIAMDMKGVPFVNSAGLASLITCLKRAREKRATLRLLSLQPQVQEVFELTQLSHVFGMDQPDEKAA